MGKVITVCLEGHVFETVLFVELCDATGKVNTVLFRRIYGWDSMVVKRSVKEIISY
jgi:hypothetical protein